MSSVFFMVFGVVFVLGTIVLLHEFGHYIAAKAFGVRVEVFSIGFGKRLIGFRKGETDYRISALPFGGYVRMTGENPLEARTGDPCEFMSHPRWQRFVIAAAGPAVNIILAVALLTGVYMVRYEHPAFLDQPAKVGWVLENSPAAKAGIEPGDLVVRIGKMQNPTWEDTLYQVLLSPGQPLDVGVQRGNEILNRRLVPDKVGRDELGYSGLEPEQQITVTDLEPNMPAAKAGMKLSDQILALNGVGVHSVDGLIRRLQQNKEAPIEVTVLRQGQELKFNVTPVLTKGSDGQPQYRIGFMSNLMHVDKLPFREAFAKSIDTNRKSSGLVFQLVEKMVERRLSMRQMSGPIGIAQASGEAAAQPGWTPLFSLMATISLQLGIFNLFPIPILDGGIILLLMLEGLMRRDISVQVKERIYQAAFLFLVLFAMLVIYNDIAKTVVGLGKP
jgi:regulator of sigma E protease